MKARIARCCPITRSDRLGSGIMCELAILFACRVGDVQLIFSMSGNFQLLSKMAFSGPYTRNHGNHF